MHQIRIKNIPRVRTVSPAPGNSPSPMLMSHACYRSFAPLQLPGFDGQPSAIAALLPSQGASGSHLLPCRHLQAVTKPSPRAGRSARAVLHSLCSAARPSPSSSPTRGPARQELWWGRLGLPMLGTALGKAGPPRHGGHLCHVTRWGRQLGQGSGPRLALLLPTKESCLSACFNLVNDAFVLLLP